MTLFRFMPVYLHTFSHPHLENCGKKDYDFVMYYVIYIKVVSTLTLQPLSNFKLLGHETKTDF